MSEDICRAVVAGEAVVGEGGVERGVAFWLGNFDVCVFVCGGEVGEGEEER